MAIKEVQVSLLPEAYPNAVLNTSSQALTDPVEGALALTTHPLTYRRLSAIGELCTLKRNMHFISLINQYRSYFEKLVKILTFISCALLVKSTISAVL